MHAVYLSRFNYMFSLFDEYSLGTNSKNVHLYTHLYENTEFYKKYEIITKLYILKNSSLKYKHF